MDLHIARAFEFFVDHVIHARAGIDQGRRDDGERAAFLNIARRAEKTLGALQGIGIHTAGQHLTRSGNDGVVSTR